MEITWLVVIFLIPVFYNPQSHKVFTLNKASLFQFLVVAMLALWLADWLLSQSRYHRLNWRAAWTSSLHLAILIFGLLAIISTAASITPAISFWGSYYRKAGLLTLICWILFFLIVAQQMRSRTQLLRAAYALLLSSAVVSIMGVLQYYFPDVISRILPNPVAVRISSTVGNPLFLSSFLAMVVPFNLALILHVWSRRKERKSTVILASLAVLLVLEFWCLLLAQYSITILLYIISLVIFILVWGIVQRKRLVMGLGLTCLIALTIIAAVLMAPLLFEKTGSETGKPQQEGPILISEEVGLENLGGRVEYWRGAADILIKSPEVPYSNDRWHFIRRAIGYGPETFTVTFQLFFPENLKSDITNINILVDRPHNDYLYLASTMGLLGLMSFLAILAVFFYLCFRYLRRATVNMDKLFLIAMAAATIQYMADIFFNLSTITPELVFWLILAMTCVIGRFIENKIPVSAELKEAYTDQRRGTSNVTRTRFYVSLGCVLALVIVGLIIAIRPFLADIYLEKGLKLQSTDSAQAVYALDQATRIEPEEANYWHALGAYTYYVGRHVKEQSFKTKVVATAAEDQYKAAELSRYVAYEYYSLADVCTYWAWSGATDKWSVAMSFYDKASQLFPGNAVILDKWSLALIIKGDLAEAKTKLDYAASCDSNWANTSFLHGLLLAREGKKEEAALKLTQPIIDRPANLNYFIDLCNDFKLYDMLSPLEDSLKIYAEERSDDWSAHALLGITRLFNDDPALGLDELNSAILSAPNDAVGGLFQAILKLTTMSPKLKEALPDVAAEWQNKLAQSPDRDTLLPALDKLLSNQ